MKRGEVVPRPVLGISPAVPDNWNSDPSSRGGHAGWFSLCTLPCRPSSRACRGGNWLSGTVTVSWTASWGTRHSQGS